MAGLKASRQRGLVINQGENSSEDSQRRGINITLPVEDDVEISLNGLFVIRAVSKFMDKSC
jgi:hypothetical protein